MYTIKNETIPHINQVLFPKDNNSNDEIMYITKYLLVKILLNRSDLVELKKYMYSNVSKNIFRAIIWAFNEKPVRVIICANPLK